MTLNRPITLSTSGVALTILLLLGSPIAAQEWARFRGPNGTGLSAATTIPAQWTQADYNWRIQLPGSGHSSPVLWGRKIFVTAATATQFTVLGVDEQGGKILWHRDYPHDGYALHKFSSFASGTCAADDERLYFTRQDGKRWFINALTHAGDPVWEHSLGELDSQHGSGHSPIVHGELVVVANDQDLAGGIVALDRRTGQVRWTLARSAGMADYSVPCVLERVGQSPALIFNTHEDGINGVDPATGRLLWATATNVLTMRSVSSPVVAGGLTFATCGSGAGGNYVIAVKPPAAGSSAATIQYDVRKSAPYVPTPLALNDRLYLWSDGGIVTCLNPATGEQKWQERAGGNYFSSPVSAGGRIYGTTTSGEVVVLAAGDEFKVLARNQLGEQTHATPALANGKIYFRTWEHLISLGGGKPPAVN